MLKFVKKIFRGAEVSIEQQLGSAYKQQLKQLKEIWHSHTYGIERAFRLFLCLIQFIYPTLLLRSISGSFGATSRKIFVELYLLLKLVFPCVVLALGFYRFPIVIWLVIYLLSETVFHLLNIIFLSDMHGAVISYTRAMLLLFINYFEIVLDFAIIYLTFNLVNRSLNPVSAIYFSFVTQTTLGYGDFYPEAASGQVIVMLQLFIVLLFVSVFINYFSAKVGNKTE